MVWMELGGAVSISDTRTSLKGNSAGLIRAGWRKWYTGTDTDRTFFVVISTRVSGCVAMVVRMMRWGERRKDGSHEAAAEKEDEADTTGSSDAELPHVLA